MQKRQINPDAVWTLATIMAVNGDVPQFGGWHWLPPGYGPDFGVVGQIVKIDGIGGQNRAVCVRAGACDPRHALPNSHPDYRPSASAIWATIPKPSEIDWDYIKTRYHRPVNECRVDVPECVGHGPASALTAHS